MSHWLLKTEPSTYSFEDLVRERTTRWAGVTNPAALIHLRAMKKGDEAVVYHTGGVRAVVGTAKIVATAYPDPDVGDPKIVVVDVMAGAALRRPVTLDQLKAEPAFRASPLLKQGRLSVVPLTPVQWKLIARLGG